MHALLCHAQPAPPMAVLDWNYDETCHQQTCWYGFSLLLSYAAVHWVMYNTTVKPDILGNQHCVPYSEVSLT